MSPGQTDAPTSSAILKEVARIASLGEPTDLQASFIVDALERYTDLRVAIAEQLVKVLPAIRLRLLDVVSKSDDSDLVVHCSLLLLMDGNDVGVAYLLRAVAVGHPLEVIIAQGLANRQITGVAQALRISLEARPSLFFPKFIELVFVLSSIDRRSAKILLNRYLSANEETDTRFYADRIGKIQEA